MEKENKKWVWVGIVILIILVFFPFGTIFNLFTSSKNVNLEPLTENDFKILSASWNSYDMTYHNGELIIQQPQRAIDWDYICNNCKSRTNCKFTSWSMQINAKEDLSCNEKSDGVQYPSVVAGGWNGDLVKQGQSTTSLEYVNLDITQEHNIIVCCRASNPAKSGEICKSITLPAKCPLN